MDHDQPGRFLLGLAPRLSFRNETGIELWQVVIQLAFNHLTFERYPTVTSNAPGGSWSTATFVNDYNSWWFRTAGEPWPPGETWQIDTFADSTQPGQPFTVNFVNKAVTPVQLTVEAWTVQDLDWSNTRYVDQVIGEVPEPG